MGVNVPCFAWIRGFPITNVGNDGVGGDGNDGVGRDGHDGVGQGR